MGILKKESRSDLKIRDLFPEEEQPTLLTCPACDGNGQGISRESEDGSYRILICRWCDGNGAVIKKMHIAFNRWKRIRAANRTCE